MKIIKNTVNILIKNLYMINIVLFFRSLKISSDSYKGREFNEYERAYFILIFFSLHISHPSYEFIADDISIVPFNTISVSFNVTSTNTYI